MYFTIFTLILAHATLLANSQAQSVTLACPILDDLKNHLGEKLSTGSFISSRAEDAPRWSLYAAPKAIIVVNVASESDVAKTVRYCKKRSITFLVQSGGNGWADTFHLGECGLLINLAGLNRIQFNKEKTVASIGGGTQVKDMLLAAYSNETRFSTPTSTCLGFLGAVLGGGISRSMGLYGQGVDQVLQLNVVTASGRSLRVNPKSNPELWYAMRGAAPNFGIVTSALVRAYPITKAQNIAWEGAITFSDDKLELLIQAIHDLDLEPEMNIDILFATSGPPLNSPIVTAIPFFVGNTSAARKAFAPILALGPASDETMEVPHENWGAFGNSFCVKGMRKPAYGASIARQGLNPATWRAIYNEFKNFVAKYPEAAGSSVLGEYYHIEKAIAIGDETSSYPFRDVPIHVVAIPLYENSSFDGMANAWGKRVRDLLRSTDGLTGNSTYINFAHGDEPLDEVYGENLARLRTLKEHYDPQNKFNQWFPLA